MNQSAHSIIIPCAGKSSRFNSMIPKPLVKINGEVSLNILLSVVVTLFDQIIIPIPPGSDMLKLFESSIDNMYLEKVKLVESKPGIGDGGAILDGMKHLQTQEDHFFVCWGDTYIVNKSIFIDLEQFAQSDDHNSFAYIPLVYLNNPYVRYILDENNFILDTQQSIDGYSLKSGYADQSIFMLSKNIDKFLKTSSSTVTSSTLDSSEISLLRSFKFMASKKLKLKSMLRKSKDSLAFNTKKDLAVIEKL